MPKSPAQSPQRTIEDDRFLCNWLSTRVIPNALGDGFECHPDNSYEQVLVEHRIAFAKALGLVLKPNTYLPPGSLKHEPKQLDYQRFLHDRMKRARQLKAS